MPLTHGEREPVMPVAATEQFFEKQLTVPDKALVMAPQAQHETHNDLCKDPVINQIAGMLKAPLPKQQAVIKEAGPGEYGEPGGLP